MLSPNFYYLRTVFIQAIEEAIKESLFSSRRKAFFTFYTRARQAGVRTGFENGIYTLGEVQAAYFRYRIFRKRIMSKPPNHPHTVPEFQFNTPKSKE